LAAEIKNINQLSRKMMNPRNFFLIGAVSILIPISSVLAVTKTHSAPIIAQGTQNQRPDREGEPSDGFAPPPPSGGRGEQRGNGELPWAKEINLSSEQEAQIKQLHEKGKKDTKSLSSQLMEAHKQMRSLFASGASPEKLRKQYQTVQGLRQKLDNKRFEMMLAERQVLTAQQRNQLGKLMEQRQVRKRQLQLR
jgi:Spy/CpxP family protein refolding chaperone